jgi:hypothetical protein
VFDPGLGQVRAGFFFSRYGFGFRAIGTLSLQPHKNKRREKIPRRVWRTYSRWGRRVKIKWPENRPKASKMGRMAGSE